MVRNTRCSIHFCSTNATGMTLSWTFPLIIYLEWNIQPPSMLEQWSENSGTKVARRGSRCVSRSFPYSTTFYSPEFPSLSPSRRKNCSSTPWGATSSLRAGWQSVFYTVHSFHKSTRYLSNYGLVVAPVVANKLIKIDTFEQRSHRFL